MTASWTTWNRYDWSERLLEYHFAKSTGRDADVNFIDVSEEALVACADADVHQTAEVRERFLDVIRASGKNGPPWTKLAGQSPSEWYAYLVAACHVFVDSEAADQRSCIEPLGKRLGPTFVQKLEVMPDLWMRLESWLAERSGDYRALRLPPLGGWNRIGQAYQLAFPRKSDQRAIGRALDAVVAADDPTLGQALDAVRGVQRYLSESMRQALATFELLLGSGATEEHLFHTAFWSAVLSAGRAVYDSDLEHQSEIGVLVSEEDERSAYVSLVAVDSPSGLGSAWEEDLNYPPWRYVCTDEEVVRNVFSGSISTGRLGRHIAGGSVPLVDNGLWELAPRNEGKRATAELVSTSLADGRDPGSEGLEAFPTNWKLMTGIELDASSDPVEHPRRRGIRLVRGVVLGTGTYLNEPLVRPVVEAPWATSVVVEHAGIQHTLLQDDAGWELRLDRSLSGPCRIVASDGANSVSRNITLAVEVAGAPKPVSKPERWSIDGSGRARLLSAETFAPAINLVSSEQRVLLSAQAGVGADRVADATWAVTMVGGDQKISLLEGDPRPTGKSAKKGDVRRWREYLRAKPANLATQEGIKVANAALHRARDLPIVDGLPVGRFATRQGSPALGGALRVEATLAGISRRRSEMRTGELAGFLHASSKYSVAESYKWEQLRDLSEAGVVDVATYLLWGKRAVFAVPPALVVHETSVGVTAVLGGLGTDLIRTDLERLARNLGVSAKRIDAIGRLVPPTLAFFADSLEELRELSIAVGLPVKFLPERPARNDDIEDLSFGIPDKYESWGASFRFASSPDASVQLWRRTDAPERYVVTVGEKSLQCRSRSTAELWAAVATGQLRIERSDTEVVSNVSIPLTVARWAAHLGGARPGFDTKDKVRRYPTPNKTTAEIVISAVEVIVADENPWSEDD